MGEVATEQLPLVPPGTDPVNEQLLNRYGQPYSTDIETVPHRRYWAQETKAGLIIPEDYEIDTGWARTKFMDHQLTCMHETEQGRLELFRNWLKEQTLTCGVPLASTGQLPACDARTSHVVSVSFGLIENPAAPTEDWKIRVATPQMDQYFHQLGIGSKEDPAPGLDGLTDEEIVAAEKLVLRDTVARLHWWRDKGQNKGYRLVTFNGKGFDLQLIRWRCVILDIDPPQLNWWEMTYPYRHKEHIDLRLLFSDGDRRAKGTQQTWADAMEIPSMEAGPQVMEWARVGEWDKISSYGDVEMETVLRMFMRSRKAL